MARAALGWSTRRLASEAHVGISTVNRFENGARAPIAATRESMRRALEAAGVEFPEGGGVRLREGGDVLQGAATTGPVTEPPELEDAADQVRAASRKSVQDARRKKQREITEPSAD